MGGTNKTLNPLTDTPTSKQQITKSFMEAYMSCAKSTKEDLIWYGDKNTPPGMKSYLTDDSESVFDNFVYVDSSVDKKYIDKLFGTPVFEFPKPIELLKQLINLCTAKDDIVLDFFSGSASTADAVMRLNLENDINLKFIMVQLPELCANDSEAYKSEYHNICEIGEERIRRAGELIKNEWCEKNKNKDFIYDIGFKVFKLDSTNIKPWDNTSIQDETNLLNYNEIFKDGRTKEDVLYEIMLKYGIFDQQAMFEKINGKEMFRVGSRYMIVCLEDEITSEDVKKIAELKPKAVVFKESGFANDNDKINAVYNLEKAGVEDVRCI